MESRQLLSGGAAWTAAGLLTSTPAIVAKATPARRTVQQSPTPADRQQLLAQWSGPGASALASLLAAGSFVSSNPPPNSKDAAVHYSASQTGTSTIVANLIVTYAGTTPPAVSANWAALPKRGRAGVIKLTENGVDQLVSFTPPKM